MKIEKSLFLTTCFDHQPTHKDSDQLKHTPADLWSGTTPMDSDA